MGSEVSKMTATVTGYLHLLGWTEPPKHNALPLSPPSFGALLKSGAAHNARPHLIPSHMQHLQNSKWLMIQQTPVLQLKGYTQLI